MGPQFLLLASQCAERIGEGSLQLQLLEKGLALESTDPVARGQLLATHAEATLKREGGDQALQCLREALSLFEQAGDVRSRAMTMGKIADILHLGDTEEALRMLTEEALPAVKRIQDMDLIANTLYQSASLRLNSNEPNKEFGDIIIRELKTSFEINSTLGRVDGIAVVGSLHGQLLAAAGFASEAIDVLEKAAAAFDVLQRPDQAAEIREMAANLLEGGK